MFVSALTLCVCFCVCARVPVCFALRNDPKLNVRPLCRLDTEQPHWAVLQYAVAWEQLACEALPLRASAWRLAQLARLSARPWRVFCCRLLAAAFDSVRAAASQPVALLRARLFLFARVCFKTLHHRLVLMMSLMAAASDPDGAAHGRTRGADQPAVC